MVERLRRDMQRLKADQDDLLTNSRDNLSTQDRIHKAALALLGAESIANFIEIIATDLAMLLDVDAVALCLETVDGKTAKLHVDGLQLLPAGTVDRVLGPERAAALLRDDTVGDPRNLRGRRRPRRSDALIRPQDRRRHAARPDCVRHAPSRLFRSRPGHGPAAFPGPHRRALHLRMARAAAAHRVIAAADLAAGIDDWQRWLQHERRASPHTLAAYRRDIAIVSDVSQRSPREASIASPHLAALTRADFRAWLAARGATGVAGILDRARP